MFQFFKYKKVSLSIDIFLYYFSIKYMIDIFNEDQLYIISFSNNVDKNDLNKLINQFEILTLAEINYKILINILKVSNYNLSEIYACIDDIFKEKQTVLKYLEKISIVVDGYIVKKLINYFIELNKINIKYLISSKYEKCYSFLK